MISTLFLAVRRVAGREAALALEPCSKDNGKHRAELQKRLVLDTEVGSVAESVYRSLGWSRAGEIPDYATTPAGKLHPTVYYYKRL